ncbi:DegT/DnrJ/EryC1/StrS family aminotransferase [Stratiformator vulcanicus]|uniref:dTDP-3-amino-3,6-dideoxy-alpha-D-galactopyranose transaminase n=1 Tax=Stratiformator vulcanicus TaxID=2527980 RepID=A0A517R232_9PLAN|nr:DegT/DnrJ/EryC1/StrS family aminotransferase [Stratiformator vulcanicus]QDT37928.1 dTDP-3-amino-3,6-dideoxy-alpha-D-galactopyranose transaminase [Stratiformator vulcanicus]
MIPRGTLDIPTQTLLAALARRRSHRLGLYRAWPTECPTVAFASVRSGLDAVLQASSWPTQSEVLMSAVNVPHMSQIIRAHGYVPVPLDVDRETLAPLPTEFESRISERTRAILVAHLLGSRIDLEPFSEIARRHRIELWEDVAQGFAGDLRHSSEFADISFFSFGTIKTRTALGGGLVSFEDSARSVETSSVQERWPMASERDFRRKIRRALLLKAFETPLLFTAATGIAGLLGINYDALLSKLTRGYPDAELITKLRHRPSRAQLDLLHRRVNEINTDSLKSRERIAALYLEALPPDVLVGTNVEFPTRWVFPICSSDPTELVRRLRVVGIDATQKASRLAVVTEPDSGDQSGESRTAAWLSRLVFLPLHPAVRARHVSRIARIVREVEMIGEELEAPIKLSSA